MTDLAEKFKEYLEQADIVKTINADLRDATQSHEAYAELEKIKKEAKRLKDQIDNVTEIALIKEKRDGARDRLQLLKEILLAEMSESGKTEIAANGKKAKLIPAVKFVKE